MSWIRVIPADGILLRTSEEEEPEDRSQPPEDLRLRYEFSETNDGKRQMSSDRRSCSDDVPQDVQAAILLKDFTQPKRI